MSALVASPSLTVVGALPPAAAMPAATMNRVNMSIPSMPAIAAPTPQQNSGPDLSALAKLIGDQVKPFDPTAPVSVTPQVTDNGGFMGGIGNSSGITGNGGMIDALKKLFGGG